MSGDRTSLNMDLDDFDDFSPKSTAKPAAEIRKEVDKVSSFPSREISPDGQMNMRGSQAVLDRFKAMCKDDRRSYVAMLEILMDRFEETGQGG